MKWELPAYYFAKIQFTFIITLTKNDYDNASKTTMDWKTGWMISETIYIPNIMQINSFLNSFVFLSFCYIAQSSLLLQREYSGNHTEQR